MSRNATVGLFASLALALLFYLVALPFFSQTHAQLIAIIALLVSLWTNEALPLGVVSLLPIILFPAFGILGVKESTINYANPIIFLFFGGFLISIALEKVELHRYIAQKILSRFVSSLHSLLLAIMSISALLSSVLSNTTTALLLMPMAMHITKDATTKARLALGVAYGASIGGVLTPIGTAPNLIYLGFMQDRGGVGIGFLQWVMMLLPLIVFMLYFGSKLLSLGMKKLHFELEDDSKELDLKQKKVLYLIVVLALLLLLNSSIEPIWSGLGLDENLILLGFGLVLFTPFFGVLEWSKDRGKIPLEIMFLFGAGFSIAAAFASTGLDVQVASHLDILADLPPFLLLLSVALLVTFATEVTSNTALISIMLPIVFSLCQSIGVDPTLVMMVATIGASFAFMLPIATPPNAIAMSSGALKISQMAKYGIIFNLVGSVMITSFAYLFWSLLI